jgi:hypothetical protein
MYGGYIGVEEGIMGLYVKGLGAKGSKGMDLTFRVKVLRFGLKDLGCKF